jgi:solute:Na+ symporter, SSS family
MQLPLIDLLVFLAYMLGIVVFGASFFKRGRSAEQYTTGAGRIPSWAVGMSIFATFVSSISFLALPGKAYQSDWNAFVFSLTIPIASVMALLFFIPLYRQANNISAYAWLEQRFGPWARMYASACYILTQLMRTGSILYLLALPLSALFGWSMGVIIVVTGISIVFYSMLGGIKAVIWTDAIQGIVLIGGALMCAVVIIADIPGGFGAFVEQASAQHKFSLGSFGLDLGQSNFWVMVLYGLFINLQNYGIDQNYVQRYMVAKTDRGAKSSALFGSLLYVPVSLLFFIIGTALFVYYQNQPQLLPLGLADAAHADKVFPHFIVHGLPAGVTGLVISAIFAAGMSTISTSVNSSATIVMSDYYKRYFNPNPTDKQSMRVLYLASALFGLVGIAIGVAMMSVYSALDAWWKLASIFSGGMLGLFLLGYFSRTAKSIEAAVGVTVGVLAILWLSLSPMYFTQGGWVAFKSPFHANLTIVIGTMAIFLTGFVLVKWRKGVVQRRGSASG